MKFLLISILFISLFSLLFGITYAKEITQAETSTSSATINSFELFWPLSAGRTEGDPLYFLKLFREQVIGWFTYGDTKKADYALQLGTKRVLEAEKLLKEGKIDAALKTLDRADKELSSVYTYVKKADSQKKFSTAEIRRDRLVSIKRLIDYLKPTSPENTYQKLDAVKEKADAVLRDYLP